RGGGHPGERDPGAHRPLLHLRDRDGLSGRGGGGRGAGDRGGAPAPAPLPAPHPLFPAGRRPTFPANLRAPPTRPPRPATLRGEGFPSIAIPWQPSPYRRKPPPASTASP